MSCCGGNISASVPQAGGEKLARKLRDEELRHSATEVSDGKSLYMLILPDVHCGGCIHLIEKHLGALEGVSNVRVNLSLKRLSYTLSKKVKSPSVILDELVKLGYPPTIHRHTSSKNSESGVKKNLLIDLAVAGFAMANIMLLSVSIWSGAEGSTRDLFHLISGLIAVPAVLFSGQTFFISAFKALRARHLNMDVPISLAVLLALGMSIFESVKGGHDAYFEASVMLIFFLLIGRYLDRLMREKAKNTVSNLEDFSPKGAEVKDKKNKTSYLSIEEIRPGMIMVLRPGDRVPVDGIIVKGQTELDRSLVTGESMPVAAEINTHLDGGVLNLTSTIEVKVLRPAKESFLARLITMIGDSELSDNRYIGMADKMVKLYAPFVHILALLAFVMWAYITKGDFHTSMNIAISVLIITCPCALGLAVPMVQVVTSSRLFQKGIVLKDGAALEKLSECDHVIFDKTGTLTTGDPEAKSNIGSNSMDAKIACSLARSSAHPASKAVAKLLSNQNARDVKDIEEIPGAGVRGFYKGQEIRLGHSSWVFEILDEEVPPSCDKGDLYFAREGHKPVHFEIIETLRPGATETVKNLQERGIPVEIISGDTEQRVRKIALQLGIKNYSAKATPQDKIAFMKKRAKEGKKTLMVGDGLNDAPVLTLSYVSMAPGSASDVSRLASDFVFLRDNLLSVSTCFDTAIKAKKLMKQNFALAFLYNILAVPIAFAGYVTPLIAAIAMSISSILVVANSLRMRKKQEQKTRAETMFKKLESV